MNTSCHEKKLAKEKEKGKGNLEHETIAEWHSGHLVISALCTWRGIDLVGLHEEVHLKDFH